MPRHTRRRLARLGLSALENREVPAVFDVPAGDTPALIAAIRAANTNNEADVIRLAAGATYVFSGAADADPVFGDSALPRITSDNADAANTLSIEGNFATIRRAGATDIFRLLFVDGRDGPLSVAIRDLNFADGQGPPPVAGKVTGGGAIRVVDADVSLAQVNITNSRADFGGGILATATSPRALTLDGVTLNKNFANSSGGGVYVSGAVDLNVLKSTFNDNSVKLLGGSGAGLASAGANVTVTGSQFIGNQGGGIVVTGGQASVDNSTLKSNTTFRKSGAGISVTDAKLTVSRSLLSQNVVTSSNDDNDLPVLAFGGGVYAADSAVTIRNSTFDGNRADSGGGGLYVARLTQNVTASAVVAFSTFTVNELTNFKVFPVGGGIAAGGGTSLTLYNSLVAGNRFGPLVNGQGPDLFVDPFADFTSLGYIAYTDSGGNKLADDPTNLLLSDVKLSQVIGPLRDNGGPTPTRLPQSDAPAMRSLINAGDPGFVGQPGETDQRGVTRVLGGRVDIGAAEVVPDNTADLAVAYAIGPVSVVSGSKTSFSFTVVNKGPNPINGATIVSDVPGGIESQTWKAEIKGSGSVGTIQGSGAINETVVILDTGASVTYTITARVSPRADLEFPTITAVARVTLTDPDLEDPDPANNTAAQSRVVLAPARPDLAVTLTADPTVVPSGGVVILTLTATNIGTEGVFGAKLQNLVPALASGQTYTSVASAKASGNKASGSGAINDVLILPVGELVTYTITLTLRPDANTTPGGVVTVTSVATITAPESAGEVELDNNTARAVIAVTPVDPTPAWLVVGGDAGSPPLINVFDTQSGALVTTIRAFPDSFRGGVRVATADFNGDGVLDIVAAAGPGGGPHVRVFDGRTFQLLAGSIGEFFAYVPKFNGGVYVAAADVNGDGTPDIITGAGAGGGPNVRVFDGKTGQIQPGPIGDFFAFDPRFRGGVRVAAADLDGPTEGEIRRAEVVVAAGPTGGPHVRAFDFFGAERFNQLAYAPSFLGGVYVAAGDVTGDGRAEIITGAGDGGGAHVRVFEVRSKLAIDVFPFGVFARTGARVGVFDANFDARLDLAVAQGPGSTSADVVVLDGVDPTLTSVYRRFDNALDPTKQGGLFVAGGSNG